MSARRLHSGGRFRCCSSQQHDVPELQRFPGLQPGDPLMAYLVQVWRGIPQSGGLGWVTYGGQVSKARAHQLLALSQRIRPNYHHKLETVTQ